MDLDFTFRASGRARLIGLTVLATLIALLAVAGPVVAGQPAPTTRFVDDDGTAGATGCNGQLAVPKKIQPAINQSNAGDTILVCPGDYPGFTIDDDHFSPNGLTVRGVVPWAARVISGPGVEVDRVISIDNVEDTTLQWLTVLARTSQCDDLPVVSLISVDNSPGTRLRANHLGTLGSDTLGSCGYLNGIRLNSSNDVEVAWNRVVDFRNTGILSDSPEFPTVGLDIHGNTLRYFHAGPSPLAEDDSAGIVVFDTQGGNISRNWIRSLPTAGQTTPQLRIGILCGGCAFEPAKVLRNHVLHVNIGIALGVLADGSHVRGNRVRSSGEVGIHVENADNSTIEDNVVTGGDGDGIVLDDGSSGIPEVGPEGNTLQNNDFSNNAGTDCIDTTVPTDNNWDDQTNLGDDANQDGLCNPGVVTPI